MNLSKSVFSLNAYKKIKDPQAKENELKSES